MTYSERFDDAEVSGTFTDPSGTEHTGELADASDVGSSVTWETATITRHGTGIQQSFQVSPGHSFEPSGVSVIPKTADAADHFFLEVLAADDVQIRYPTAPPDGTDNLEWLVEVRG